MSVDSYMNLQVSFPPSIALMSNLALNIRDSRADIRWLAVQLASTEEYIDGQFTGNLGEVLIR